MLNKTIIREIKKSFGRYIAILAIVALGVGFFSGLKVCKEAMIETGDKYLKGVSLYDFRGISTLGYDDDQLKYIEDLDYVSEAEGSITMDALLSMNNEDALVFRALSIPEKINLPTLVTGRMPSSSNECLLDNMWSTRAEDLVGKKLTVSENNDEDTLEAFKSHEFTVVGLCRSPLYMNYERGTTSLGGGTVSGFIYVPKDSFDLDYYTEIYTTVDEYHQIYSPEYEEKIEKYEDSMKADFTKAANMRYDSLYDEYETEYNEEVEKERKKVIDEAIASAGDLSAMGPMADTIRDQIREEAEKAFDEELGDMPEPPFDKPKVYSLDRESNVGYICFDNDTSIIDSISRVFPIFFFLVAALVCMTSMTRMVDEQRGQMGVLKALGYSNTAILENYLKYSGSATIIGGIIGFFAGAIIFPYVIWRAYSMMYDFADSIELVINYKLGFITILAALAATVGATIFSCIKDTREVPAELIRPKAPKPGQRILLERIKPIWNKIGFLYKVSLRNIFRYKKRFFMMLLGISGCTSLLVTGFGILDSISHVADFQYDEISLYDYDVVFNDPLTEDQRTEFVKEVKDSAHAEDVLFCEQISMSHSGQASNPLRLIVTDFDNLDSFIHLRYRGEDISAPGKGEIVICESYAERHKIHVGDTITIHDDDMNEGSFKVSAICENYIYNYGYVSPETFRDVMGRDVKYNTAFVLTDVPKKGSADYVSPEQRDETLNEAAAKVRDLDNITSVSLADEFRHRIDNMMKSLNAIVYLIVICAGILAFIVIYNLTNINITERIREIATIKVLGFHAGETSSYVFRENIFLTAISGLVGLFLGKLLISYVIGEIKVDMIYFPTRIIPTSYLLSYLLTFVFACIVMFALYFKLQRISMTESLKTVE